jgi:hypothetical protein
MDRLSRTLAGCGLALLLAAPGCKSTANKVPPGRRFMNDGQQQGPMWGSDSHAMNSMNSPAYAMQPNTMPGQPGGASTVGTPMAGGSTIAVPTQGMFGAPGTSGTAGGGYTGSGTGATGSPAAGANGNSLMAGPNLNPAQVDPRVTPSGGYQPPGSLPMPDQR